MGAKGVKCALQLVLRQVLAQAEATLVRLAAQQHVERQAHHAQPRGVAGLEGAAPVMAREGEARRRQARDLAARIFSQVRALVQSLCKDTIEGSVQNACLPGSATMSSLTGRSAQNFSQSMMLSRDA